ncbi:hypothetical protein HPB49_012403 [Dermacentor silvarum]|uniref:Uncharacterized protein n=1 Tax=Dermacentor silvarum TaxID=543639 RepID=A0ACB8DCJ6_DERSI|nr:hypothetical protein HPB49_012403 [Dermacentor silvarum]
MEDRRSAAFEPRNRGENQTHDIDARTDTLGTGQQVTKPKYIKGKVIKAGRMPRLPKDEIKIVVRPQGNLDTVKVGASTVTAAIFVAAGITGEESAEDTVCPNSHQNIVVVSTPKRSSADRYAKMRQIHIKGKPHEVNAYETAPDNTTKGVIRGIPIEDGPQVLDKNIVNQRNPLALAAKRIGTTTTVVIAFDKIKEDFPPIQPTRRRSRSRSPSRSRSRSRQKHSRAPTRSRSRTPAPVDKVSWADTVRGTAREGVGKAPQVPDHNQKADNGVLEALRKENAVMRELVQKLMQEMRELRRERAAADQNKQSAQPPVPASVPDADAPAPKNGRYNNKRTRDV